MKKLFLVSTILVLAAIASLGQADARPGGCVRGAIVGGIVGHFVGHGGLGAAAGCAYGIHKRNSYDRSDDSEGRSSYERRGGDGQRSGYDRY
ncbi:MAG: hypothetical protein DLM71_09225 [Chloroflexi bacterium]|nr:MAG: hypothetical protein DLM71_09225 [Chloroflexota bacterium]